MAGFFNPWSGSQAAVTPQGIPSAIAGWRQRFSRPQHIYHKIGYGYLAAIAIGLTGSLGGLVLADYFQGRGLKQLADAQTQSHLLGEFEQAAERVQLYNTRTALLANADVPASHNGGEATIPLTLARQTLGELREFFGQDRQWLAAEPTTVLDLLATYLDNLERQRLLLEAFLADPTAAAAIVADLDTVTTELDQQHVTLITLLQVAQQQEQQAGSILETIQGYEKGIIVTSMLLAAAIAGLLAWRTTRAIAQPIEAVTQVAQRVALESNFSLRAPATTGDEIGLLAAALNHLIERVEVHTQALEAAATDAKTQTHALEQTLATLRRTQARLLHAEKMSSLGQLVAGVAHEINNPLGFITGNVQYVQEYVEALLAGIDRLQQELPQPSPALQADLANLDLDFIQQDLPQVLQSLQLGTDRITSIVLSLRRFSRLQETDIKPADLHKGLNSTLVILGHRLKANADRPAITVVKDYGDLAPVNCYGGDLNQVFMNILGNAIDAIDECWRDKILPMTPEIRIRTRWGGDQVEVAIANNGNPMPPEVQNRAFDPFFTTKPVGKGTGMGLSISYDIITQKHQGTLVCHSPLDNETYGAEFILTIPHDLIHRRQQSAPLPTDASVLRGGEVPVENGG